MEAALSDVRVPKGEGTAGATARRAGDQGARLYQQHGVTPDQMLKALLAIRAESHPYDTSSIFTNRRRRLRRIYREAADALGSYP